MFFTSEVLNDLLSLLLEERKRATNDILREPPIYAYVEDLAHGIATLSTRDAFLFESGDSLGIILNDGSVREFGIVINSCADMMDVLVVRDKDVLDIVNFSAWNESLLKLCEYEPLIGYDLQINLIECLVSHDKPCRINISNKSAISTVLDIRKLGELKYVDITDVKDIQGGFKLDDSQIRAVKAALALEDNELLLIVGPPGSGKTRVIAKIANEFMREGETVLIASHTNRAVDNAIELLPIDYTLRVGRPEKVLPTISSYLLSQKVRGHLGDRLKSIEEKIKRTIKEYRRLLNDYKKIKARGNQYEIRKWRSILANFKKHIRELVDERARIVKGAVDELSLKTPIIGSTLIKSQLYPLKDRVFDVVIIDEASQASLTLALLAMVKGRKWIIVGDHKQLPPIFKSVKDVSVLERHSVFMNLIKKYPQRQLWLEVNYRSNCEIVEFLSKYIYEDRIKPYIKCTDKILRLEKAPSTSVLNPDKPIVFVHVEGESEWDVALRSVYNIQEVSVVVKLIRDLVNCGIKPCDIGVVSPYRAQARKVKEKLTEIGLSEVEVSTVDAFQGREKDVIIFTVTSTVELKFASEPHRLNVALSRARKKLIVVGNRRAIESHSTLTLIHHFLKHCDKLGRVFTI